MISFFLPSEDGIRAYKGTGVQTCAPPVSPQIEVVFVPVLALDKRGHRVGYGKGFYDRFLAQCSAQVIKVGLSFFEPISEIKDTDKFDIPLDYAVTPSTVFKFSG